MIFIDLLKGERCDGVPCELVLAIGNFDGVHLGHKSLLERAVSISAELSHRGENTESGVFCFSVPPADYLMEDPPRHISSLEGKLRAFAELGMRYAVIAGFEHLRDVSAKDFIEVLKNECACRAIVCGFNFRFGRGGEGNAELLKSFFGEWAMVVDAVTTDDGVPISSSRIRGLLENGDLEMANQLLGHPFTIEGSVIHGKALGRQMGLPTINQNFAEMTLIPRRGIYVSRANVGGKSFSAVTNIGSRPTVENDGRINCETHLMDFCGELYGEKISVELLCRLRDEKKFPSESALKAAIEGDIISARRYFDENK